jgi:hypothetical protein
MFIRLNMNFKRIKHLLFTSGFLSEDPDWLSLAKLNKTFTFGWFCINALRQYKKRNDWDMKFKDLYQLGVSCNT